jgi:hypothetical protein
MAVGIWILVLAAAGDRPVDLPLTVLSAVNILGALVILAHNWINAWKVSRLVLDNRRARLLLMLRVNPVFVMAYWLFWSLSIVIGIQMFVRDKGLVWERTEKVDANHDLVRDLELVAVGGPGAGAVIDQRDIVGRAPSRAYQPATCADGAPMADQAQLEQPAGRHRRG